MHPHHRRHARSYFRTTKRIAMAGGKIKHRSGARLQGGIPFDKSKGQHILKNPALVDSIVDKVGLKPTD
ncbi:hypothetical protein GUJ93_ZPchr0010g7971 [Zizania palustris]|uniref:Uncharacterized protein n=1 Tax=Zizania palustris TaxID=103762 RepID=A0A8J5WCE1_ZIZPA|nr:hypothetical protein GUJ93_ZPchr0010g7971 [Zizania palustris]